MMNTRLAAASLAVLLAAAPAMAQEPPRRHGHELSAADQAFLQMAGTGNAAEIEMGRLASERAGHGPVKMFGRWMASTHAFAGRELATITGGRHRAAPPSTPTPEAKAVLDRLRGLSGDDFDRAFLQAMVEDHERSLQAFRQEAQDGGEHRVKAFAANFVPAIEVHLQQARDLLQDIFHVGPEGQGRAANANLQGAAGSTQPATPAR